MKINIRLLWEITFSGAINRLETWTLLISISCTIQTLDNTKPFSMLWHEDILSAATSLDPTPPRTPTFVGKISPGSWHVSALSGIKQSLNWKLLRQKPSGACVCFYDGFSETYNLYKMDFCPNLDYPNWITWQKSILG